MNRLIARLTVIGAFASLPCIALAGPTIIRDARVQDIGASPFLGRGYSISTNTFQSACMKDVVLTEPSYDFSYTFKEAESDETTDSKTKTNVVADVNTWWVRGKVDETRETTKHTNVKTQNLVVVLNVSTYYASIDEANSHLSETAQGLLTGEDVPGFFSSCGPYYTRSINRSASFYSILNYRSETSKEDSKFAQKLNQQIRGWFAKTSVKSNLEAEFGREASKKNLVIYSRGWGIGKNEDASLIATDADSFKAAIKQAFVSMQNPGTGRVVSIEVVPWVENTEFQSLLNLRGEDVLQGKEVPLYEKKDILTHNAEFLSEVQRQARHILNMHYKAKLCTTWVKSNWTLYGSLNSDYADAPLRNHRKPWETLTVRDLWLALRGEEEGNTLGDEFMQHYLKFMYEGSDTAMQCINDLFHDPNAPTRLPIVVEQPAAGAAKATPTEAKPTEAAPTEAAPAEAKLNPGYGRGIFLQRYLNHASCRGVEGRFGGIELPEKIEDYCMPELR